ncbi:MAG: hypothetical protein CM15mP83_7200 [Flavobacteriaceae bacterium]|nr:MAG: hypothetical protein CM15mP83_7200 [Flavobacteriaceae bacterium]
MSISLASLLSKQRTVFGLHFGEVVFQIADEQNVNFKIFNTDGKLITNTQLPTNDEDVSISSGNLALCIKILQKLC